MALLKDAKKQLKYINRYYQFRVKNRQETDIYINPLLSIQPTTGDGFNAYYSTQAA
jgi:hypothetical protein